MHNDTNRRTHFSSHRPARKKILNPRREHEQASHLILYPKIGLLDHDRALYANSEMQAHAEKLLQRIDKNPRRKALIHSLFHDNTRPLSNALLKLYKSAKTIYIVAHSNGETIGLEGRIVCMDPKAITKWLMSSGLMRPGITVKFMSCFSGPKRAITDRSVAGEVAKHLKDHGIKGITVRGYSGSVREEMLNGIFRTTCNPSMPLADGSTDKVRASKAAVDFRI